MNEQKKPGIPPEEREAVHEKAEEARQTDKNLDEYDKEVADSFPASDPPVHP